MQVALESKQGAAQETGFPGEHLQMCSLSTVWQSFLVMHVLLGL